MKQEIVDHGDPRKYYAAIPKIVLRLGLNTYELALYVHLKDAAGDKGVCFKSRATLAKETGMSPGMITKARQSLAMPRKELSGKALIHVKEEANKEGGKPRCIITISDIWLTNMQRFTTSPHDVEAEATSHGDSATSPHTDQRHHTTSQRHTAATKNNPKEEPVKKHPEEKPSDGMPFASERFREAFTTYETYRQTELKKPLRPIGRDRLLSQLRGMGESRAVAALNYSMACGYQGVFEEKKNGNGHKAEGLDAVREVLAEIQEGRA